MTRELIRPRIGAPPTVEVLLGDRQSGKTLQLIARSADTGEVIVTLSQREAERIARIASDQRLTMPTPLTFDAFIRKAHRGIATGFLIDEAQQLLQQLAGPVPVHALALYGRPWTVDDEAINVTFRRVRELQQPVTLLTSEKDHG